MTGIYEGAGDFKTRAPEPSEANGSEVRCSRCGTSAPSGTVNCPECGVFLPANPAALRHGLRRFQDRGTLPAEVRDRLDAFRDELVAAQGGAAELEREPVRRAYVDKLLQLEASTELLMGEVIRRGIDSRPGRAAYDRLLGTWDRWHRFAQALGMARRQKPAPSLDDVLAGRASDAR